MSLRHVEPDMLRVPLVDIDEPALPSRTTMDEDALNDLAADMLLNGFTSTMILARVGARYEVIAGHRRWHAARKAQLVAVPALVYPSKLDGIEAIQHGENKRREDLAPSDEAIWFQELYEQRKDDGTDGVARRVGEKRDYVERRMALLHGHEEVFRALQAKEIGVGVAEQLNRCTDPQHARYLLHTALTCGATVGLVQQWIHEWKHLHAHVVPAADPNAPPVVASAPVVDNYFTCRVCGLTENAGNMRPVQIHDYCQQAVFLPALEFFSRRSDYVRRPRTDREAIVLINELMEMFPSLAEGSATAADPAARS